MFKSAIVLLAMAPLVLAQSPRTSQAASNPSATSQAQDHSGVQRAIQFERLKAREDAMQARKENRHPERYQYRADRKDENSSTVKDPGSAQWQRHKTSH